MTIPMGHDRTLPDSPGEPYPVAACMLGCSVDLVRKLIRQGLLDAVQISPRKVLVTRESIDRFLARRRVS